MTSFSNLYNVYPDRIYSSVDLELEPVATACAVKPADLHVNELTESSCVPEPIRRQVMCIYMQL